MVHFSENPTWEISKVSLYAYDLSKSRSFYGEIVGLSGNLADNQNVFSNGLQELSLFSPNPSFAAEHNLIHNPQLSKFVNLSVRNIDDTKMFLKKNNTLYSTILKDSTEEAEQIICYDPSMNLIGFSQRDQIVSPADNTEWFFHHVNLQAHNVRECIAWYIGAASMIEGTWSAPSNIGDFSIDPKELAVLPLGGENRGLHIIRPDAGFGKRNGFAHNPSIGGHPAFCVPDIQAVMLRLDSAQIPYSYARTYAMTGYHQVYVYDPSFNLIEINQRVE